MTHTVQVASFSKRPVVERLRAHAEHAYAGARNTMLEAADLLEECARIADTVAQRAADDTEARNLDMNYGRIDAAEEIAAAIRSKLEAV